MATSVSLNSSTVAPSSSTAAPSSSTVASSSSTVAPSSSTVAPSSPTVAPSSATVAPASKKRVRNWKAWTTDEMNEVKMYFKENLKTQTLPSKQTCEKFLKLYNIQRQWTSVKDCIRNCIRRASKTDNTY